MKNIRVKFILLFCLLGLLSFAGQNVLRYCVIHNQIGLCRSYPNGGPDEFI